VARRHDPELTDELREGLDYRGAAAGESRGRDSPADQGGDPQGGRHRHPQTRATIDTPSELMQVVRSARVGQSVSVTVVRDGARRTLNARLLEWPDSIDEESDPLTPEVAPRAPSAPRHPACRSRRRAAGEPLRLERRVRLERLRPDAAEHGPRQAGRADQDLDDGLGEALGVPDGKGVLVSKVIADTPAERAGMKSGDVSRASATVMWRTATLCAGVAGQSGRVSITVMRKGRARTVDAELESDATRGAT